MLYALRHPVALVALLAAFVLGVTVRGFVQARLSARFGDRSGLAAGRGSLDPRRHLDPFGAVAAALSGVGWGHPVERPSYVRPGQRGRILAVLLAGPVAVAILGALFLGGYAAIGGPAGLGQAGVVPATLHATYLPENAAQTLLLFAGIELVAMAVLALIPLPPLDGGRILFLYAPRTPGWQKAEYHLAEQNIGTAILLALLLIPITGQDPLLLFLLDLIVYPLLRLVSL
ncbi:MAG: site-2 protease family protein [Frankiaceae bacterium]